MPICSLIALIIEAMKPYLKWAGSKTKLTEKIGSYVPSHCTRIIEPFGGTGTVSLNLADKFKEHWVNDFNPDLINIHQLIVHHPDYVLSQLKALLIPESNNEFFFRKVREEFNSTLDTKRKAILFIYLNRHCFNGLCRYSAKGTFNTPFGRYKSVYLPEKEILSFSVRLRKATFTCFSFEKVMNSAGKGDFLYCDPPYAPLTETSNFTAYASGKFTAEQQRKIAELASQAQERGAVVLISNHDTPFTRDIYSTATSIESIEVNRSISANGALRSKAKEVFAFWGRLNQS